MTKEQYDESIQRLKGIQEQAVKDSGAPEICTCEKCSKEFKPYWYEEPWMCQSCRGNGSVEDAVWEEWEGGGGEIECSACDGKGTCAWVEQKVCPACMEYRELEMGYDRDDD